MANPYFDLSLITRMPGRAADGRRHFANNHSAVAAAAYLGRSALYDQRQARWHDYRRAPGAAVHEEILLPAGAPAHFAKPHVLWNAAEKIEKRRDAQLARRLILGLPHELEPAEQIALLRDFLSASFVARGMIAHFAIHAPGPEQDQRHWHAHVLLTLRRVNRTGFWSHKERKWNTRTLTSEWRADWAHAQNRVFRAKGLDLAIDPRSLKPAQLLPADRLQQRIAADRVPEKPVGKQDWLTGQGRDGALRDIHIANLAQLDATARAVRHLHAGLNAADPDLHRLASRGSATLERLLRDPEHPATRESLAILQRLGIERLLAERSGLQARALPSAPLSPYDVRNNGRSGSGHSPEGARGLDFSTMVPVVTAYDIAKFFGLVRDDRSFLEQIRQAMDYAQLLADREAERRHKLEKCLAQRRQRTRRPMEEIRSANRQRSLRLVRRRVPWKP